MICTDMCMRRSTEPTVGVKGGDFSSVLCLTIEGISSAEGDAAALLASAELPAGEANTVAAAEVLWSFSVTVAGVESSSVSVQTTQLVLIRYQIPAESHREQRGSKRLGHKGV